MKNKSVPSPYFLSFKQKTIVIIVLCDDDIPRPFLIDLKTVLDEMGNQDDAKLDAVINKLRKLKNYGEEYQK